MAEMRKRGNTLTDTDIASDKMGKNRLQGDNQANVRNQRRAVPDARQETDSVTESFRKLDRNKRARKDRNKGAMKPDR